MGYRVIIQNNDGQTTKESSAVLTVVPIDGIEPDVIRRPRVNGPVKLGDRLELVCQIKSDPEVNVKWNIGKENGQKEFTESKNEYTVTTSDMGDNTYEYKLVISEIKQYHNGPGYLFAEN